MEEWAARISRVTVNHFMNVSHGQIKFPCTMKGRNANPFEGADILGIYGQNGSGKTAFIYCLNVLKKCLSGMPLGQDLDQFIQIGEKEAVLDFCITIKVGIQIADMFYHIILRRDESHDGASIVDEKLSIKFSGGRQHDIFHCVRKKELLPKKWRKVLTEGEENPVSQMDLYATQEVIFSQHRSFIFSQKLSDLVDAVKEKLDKQAQIELDCFRTLITYGEADLDVMGTKDMGFINLHMLQPIHISISNAHQTAFGTIAINIMGPSLIPAPLFKDVEGWVKEMNVVLTCLIPGMRLKLNNLGEELNGKGSPVIRSELVSVRGVNEIPIRYESEGIKKILSFLQLFIRAYNVPAMTMVVDELDAGIFEYLLGEMLGIFRDSGKGQIIFTSHNLRPLEVLDKDSIVFTTTDPDDRYTRLTYVKPNNNLRDLYYKTILLGGEDKELYQETERYELGLALRKAGSHEKA